MLRRWRYMRIQGLPKSLEEFIQDPWMSAPEFVLIHQWMRTQNRWHYWLYHTSRFFALMSACRFLRLLCLLDSAMSYLEKTCNIVMTMVLTVWGEKGSLLGLGAEETMKTSSAPRSSSVRPLQERSTSAFWEMSMEALTTKHRKNEKVQFIWSVSINDNMTTHCY